MYLLPTFGWKLKIYPAVTYFLAGNFYVELEMEKTIVGNNEGQFCLHRGGVLILANDHWNAGKLCSCERV